MRLYGSSLIGSALNDSDANMELLYNADITNHARALKYAEQVLRQIEKGKEAYLLSSYRPAIYLLLMQIAMASPLKLSLTTNAVTRT